MVLVCIVRIKWYFVSPKELRRRYDRRLEVIKKWGKIRTLTVKRKVNTRRKPSTTILTLFKKKPPASDVRSGKSKNIVNLRKNRKAAAAKICLRRNFRLSKSQSTLSGRNKSNNPTAMTPNWKDFTALEAVEIEREARNHFLSLVRKRTLNPKSLRNNRRKNHNQKRKRALNRTRRKNLK